MGNFATDKLGAGTIFWTATERPIVAPNGTLYWDVTDENFYIRKFDAWVELLTGSSGTGITGTIANNQVAFGTAPNTIGGSNTFTWADGTNAKGIFEGPSTSSFSANISPLVGIGIPEQQTNRLILNTDGDVGGVGNMEFFQANKDVGMLGHLLALDATTAAASAIVGYFADVFINVPTGQTNNNIQTGFEGKITAYGAGSQLGLATFFSNSINSGTGTVTTLTGYYAAFNANTGGGVVHNSYGYLANDMSGVGDTLNAAYFAAAQTAGAHNWAFYAAGGPSFFKGSITLAGSSSGSATISTAAAAGTPNIILLPTTTGAAGTFLQTNGANPQQTSWVAAGSVVASGTATMPTGALTANTSSAAVTVAGAGILATDAIEWAFNAAPGTGYTEGVFIAAYVTSGNVNFIQTNPTAGSRTPAAATLNWRVIR
jgi:hypothetical protein